MLEKIIRESSRIGFHIIILLVAFIMLYLSFFSGLPTAQNNWSFPLRNSPVYILFVISIIFFLVSILLFLKTKSVKSDTTTLKINEVVAEGYKQLRTTQRSLLVYFYSQIPDSEIPLEDFFTRYSKVNPGMVDNVSELYFRMKDLSNKKLLYIKTVGENVSILIKKADVQKELYDRKYIRT